MRVKRMGFHISLGLDRWTIVGIIVWHSESRARVPLEGTLALRPDYFDSNALLGATLFALEQDFAAFSVHSYAHRFNPEDQGTRELLFKTGSIFGIKSREAKNFPEAIPYVLAARNLKPQDPQVHARLAVVYGEAGDQAKADAEKQLAQKVAAGQ